MLVLTFDTETSGLPVNGQPIDHPRQPHLVQLAALLKDDAREIARLHCVIRCPVDPHPMAIDAHGYSKEMTERWGIDPQAGLHLLDDLAKRAAVIVAHNMKFDANILRIAYHREHGGFPAWLSLDGEAARSFCTMEAAKPICRMPPTAAMRATGRYSFKPPKLEEALDILCGHKLEGAHDAMADVLGCAMLFEWLRERGHVDLAA